MPPAASAGDEALRRYYAARAAEYDSVYLKPERQQDLRAIEAWLPLQFAGRRVLEVACGTGHWTPWLARTAASVHAIDAAPQTLEVARARGLPRHVTLGVGDAYALPRAGAPYEAAFAGFWISHVPRRRRRGFLEGLCRVLQPGAPVVLIDNRYVQGSSTPIGPPDAAGDTWQQRSLADGSVHRVLKNFPEEAELAAALEGLGGSVAMRRWAHYWALCFTVS